MTAESTLDPEHSAPAEGWLLALPLLPTPATLQGPDFRIVEANAAFAALFELPTDAMAGRDPIAFEPPEAQPGSLAERSGFASTGVSPPLLVRRLIDSLGVERWFHCAVTRLSAADGTPLWLTLWHEVTGEVAARAQSRRAQDELAQWFELSGTGMVVYDTTGLIKRCNAAFEALVEQVPQVMGSL